MGTGPSAQRQTPSPNSSSAWDSHGAEPEAPAAGGPCSHRVRDRARDQDGQGERCQPITADASRRWSSGKRTLQGGVNHVALRGHPVGPSRDRRKTQDGPRLPASQPGTAGTRTQATTAPTPSLGMVAVAPIRGRHRNYLLGRLTAPVWTWMWSRAVRPEEPSQLINERLDAWSVHALVVLLEDVALGNPGNKNAMEMARRQASGTRRWLTD